MIVRMLRCLWNCRPGRRPPAGEEGPTAGARTASEMAGQVTEELQTLLDIPGIGPKTVQYLHEGGYARIADIREATEADLAAVEGVGPRAAAALKKALSQ